ncbi:MAG: hypothetical protein B6245_17540 [Desulfobacteraceae bacterium 4572_88]|nr:MAG: hypothetical protein B6245_17540 [Desulfobacteraceae bacterium 4572_88]
MIPKHIRRIPYGIADFEKIRYNNLYYVDKTKYIPVLESSSYYVFFIRPRRFGKSLWISVLENYYDINKKDLFWKIFGDTWIGKNPTEERNAYLIMTFNFSLVNPDIQFVHNSFELNGKAVIKDFLQRYEPFFNEKAREAILSLSSAADQLRELLFHAFRENLKIYMLIDEYDNFANTILSTSGEQAYQDLTHGGGFFRYFFNLLKGGTSRGDSGLAKLFITGVSPVTMDDVTSGFNIGENLSTDPDFNGLLGFDEEEVRGMLNYYRQAGLITLDQEFCLGLMREWYDSYRFSKYADVRMFNSDMVLYFIREVLKRDALPDELIDQNIRIDYGKLRHLMLTDQKLNGNFSQLQRITEAGETVCKVEPSFPLERLTERGNFISLLYYFGLLSFDSIRRGMPVLRIPNRTVEKLMCSYFRDAFQDADIFRTDLWKFAELVGDMAYQGKWHGVFDFLAEEIRKQTSVRDYLEGEKVIQGFLLAYLNVTDYYLTSSEQEASKGFADLWLAPFLAKFPDMRFAYLIDQ